MALRRTAALTLLMLGSLASVSAAETSLPDAIAAPGESVVLSVHAEGAQVYECKVGADGKLAWGFREPIATLLLDGKTVGRHYAGPNWEHSDGSAVVGKVAGSAPGATQMILRGLNSPWFHSAAAAFSLASPRCSGSIPAAASLTAPATRPGPSAARPIRRNMYS